MTTPQFGIASAFLTNCYQASTADKEDWIKVQNAPETDGNTKLHYASAVIPNENIVRYLIGLGEKIDAPNDLGETPFLLAVKLAANSKLLVRRKLIMGLLKACGADINATDKSGNTCLHVLINNSAGSSPNNIADLFSFLLQQGANLNAANKNGDTPLSLALACEEGLVQMLGKLEIEKLKNNKIPKENNKVSNLCKRFENNHCTEKSPVKANSMKDPVSANNIGELIGIFQGWLKKEKETWSPGCCK